MLNKIQINRKFWINLVFFVAGAVFLLYLYTKYRVAPHVAFAELELKTPEGQIVHLSDYKGKVLFLNFWETWCGPCREEMPSIERAREQLDSMKYVFVAIGEEDPAKIAAFRDQNNYKFTFLISTQKFSEIGINTYPTSYIVDKEGNIVLSKIGGADWSSPEMIDRLKELGR